MKTHNPSYLVLSLDTELAWGLSHAKGALPSIATHMARTHHHTIPRLLDTLVSYGLSATWAIVGLLGCHNEEDAYTRLPTVQPTYTNERLRAYRLLEQPKLLATYHDSLFAPALVSMLRAAPGQEVATHTFAHLYTLANQQPGALAHDLQAAQAIHKHHRVPMTSIVFPGNQYDANSLQVCQQMGLKTYRGNPDTWLLRARTKAQEHSLLRILRGAEAYAPLTSPHIIDTPLAASQGLLNVWGSRFLRPVQSGCRELEHAKTKHIERELEATAKTGGIYHLWWHPHNMTHAPEQAFAQLASLATTFRKLHIQYGMKSLTMAECMALSENAS